MADIDVVPKRRSLTWLWILAALVIVALIIWAMSGNNEPAAVGFLTPLDSIPSGATARALGVLSA